MGKRVRYLGEDEHGRIFYQRNFTEALRPFLSEPRSKHKVSLGVRFLNASAMRVWEAANRQFETDVRAATVAKQLHEKKTTGKFDRLSDDLLKFLVDTFERDWLLRLDAALKAQTDDRVDRLKAGIEWMMPEYLGWRAENDREAMEEHWGPQLDALLEEEGYRLDPNDEDARDRLLWALNETALKAKKPAKKILRGKLVDIPSPPHRPARKAQDVPAAPEDSFESIVEKLLESKTAPVGAPTKESNRAALRFFREACGSPAPKEITRAMVGDWLEMLAQKPALVPKDQRNIPLPKLVTLYANRDDVPRLSQKSLRGHASALGASWKRAVKAGRIDRDWHNPFSDPHLEKVKVRRAPKGFSAEEVEAIFGLPMFTEGERPRGGKGEASYWLPLIMLFTGARPEEVAQLLVADIYKDPKSQQWVLRITDEGLHPHKGQQRLKNGETGRTFPVPATLVDLGLLRYHAALKKAGEAALFPMLRVKGERGNLYDQFGQWWSGFIKDHGVVLDGLGRQPMREFRHTWTTAARTVGVPREVMSYITGHKQADKHAGDDYGDRSPLGQGINKVQFEGFKLESIRPWSG